MIDAIKTWIIGVIAISFAVSLGEQMVTQKAIGRVWSLAGSILVILAVLSPLVRLPGGGGRLALSHHRGEVEEMTEMLRRQGEEELALGIAGQLEAYISDKAKALGLAGEIRVKTSAEEGVVVIEGVELAMPFDPQLSDYLSREVGLSREEQQWQEE